MKNKKIITITVLLVVIVIAGVIGILYARTDLFKTKEQIFYKYLFKTTLIEPEIAQRYEKIVQNINSSNSSSNGNFDCSIAANDNTTNIANIQNLFSIKYNTLENKFLKQSYADFTISSNNEDMIILRYLKDNNTYALKEDHIVNKYLAVQNSNLREFAKKLGIENAEKLPDSIPQMTIEDFLKIDNEDFKRITMTYGKIITDKLEEENFTKTTNSDGTETIELSLTEQEVADILKAILETIKNDEATLNIIIEKASLLQYELNIDSLKTSIQEQIDKIMNEMNSTEENFLRIAVTENGKDTLKIDFQTTIKNAKEQTKLPVSCSIDLSENNKIGIIVKDTKENYKKIDITFGYEKNSVSMNIDILDLNELGNVTQSVGKIQYQISNYESDDITQKLVITLLSEDGVKTQFNINNQRRLKQDIQIEKITNANSEILNNKTSEELNNLIYAIVMKVQYLYGNQISTVKTIR